MSEQERVSLTQNPSLQPSGEKLPLPGDSDYVLPTELVPLPSRGKVYPLDSVFHGVESIEIKSMSANEENILSSRALLKQGKAISTLLQACMCNRSVHPDTLLVGDRNAILVAIRITGYGADYSPEVTCPKCEEKNKPNPPFNLAKMEIKPLGTDPVEAGVNAFRFVLPVCKKEVVFKLLTGLDERELSVLSERKKKLAPPGAVETNITDRLLAQVYTIGEESDRNKLEKIVRNMSPRDSMALRKYINKIEPGIDMAQNFICPSCGEESEVDAPIGVSFFWPDD